MSEKKVVILGQELCPKAVEELKLQLAEGLKKREMERDTLAELASAAGAEFVVSLSEERSDAEVMVDIIIAKKKPSVEEFLARILVALIQQNQTLKDFRNESNDERYIDGIAGSVVAVNEKLTELTTAVERVAAKVSTLDDILEVLEEKIK
jgi:hypothetical protein